MDMSLSCPPKSFNSLPCLPDIAIRDEQTRSWKWANLCH